MKADTLNKARIAESDKRKSAAPIRLKVALILCAALLVLSVTALAITFATTARYDSEEEARRILSETYGLTGDMIDIFGVYHVGADDAWVMTFKPLVMNIGAIGEYTVTKDADGTLTAAWSNDGVDLSAWEEGDLLAPAWAAPQLEKAISLRAVEAIANNYTSGGTLTITERAALDAPLLAFADSGVNAMINIAPGEDDLQESDALALAIETICGKYGITKSALDFSDMYSSFLLDTSASERKYNFHIMSASRTSAYWCKILSPSGEIMRCDWLVDPEDHTLPEGDLNDYRDAVDEYIADGAFELLGAADKASVAARFERAGLRSLLPDDHFVVLKEGEPSEGDILQIAYDELIRRYGFTMDTLDFFSVKAALVDSDGASVWQISLAQSEKLRLFYGKDLGAYTLTLNAADGAVMSCDWSLESQMAGKTYTKSDFGSSRIFSAYMLPWVQEIMAAQQVIRDKYPDAVGNPGEMNVEDDAASDQLARDAGWSLSEYRHLLPGEGDVQEDEAIELAKQYLVNQRNLSLEQLEDCPYNIDCYLSAPNDGSSERWGITFYDYGPDKLDMYTVLMHLSDGTLERIIHDNAADSNG